MNGSQIARFCATVKPLALLLFVTACGSAEGEPTQFDDLPAEATGGGSGGSGSGSGGGVPASPATAGASIGGEGAGGAAAGGGGSGATEAGASVGGASEATGGQPGGGAGASSGGSAAAGTSGAAAAGAGGGSVDPLDPKPLAGCPGYVKALVPKGTCIWAHGTFKQQTETCSLANPTERTCGTASAVSSDTSLIVSSGAVIERFVFDDSGCPKSCQ